MCICQETHLLRYHLIITHEQSCGCCYLSPLHCLQMLRGGTRWAGACPGPAARRRAGTAADRPQPSRTTSTTSRSRSSRWAPLSVIIVTKLVCSVAAGADPRAVSRAADDALPRPDQLDRAPRHRQDIPGHAVRAGVRSVARVTC